MSAIARLRARLGQAARERLAGLERFFLEPIDARAYALTRIAYGLLFAAIVIEQWPIRVALFSREGMVAPRTDLFLYLPLAHVHAPDGVTVLMALAGLASVCLVLGLGTRLALFYLYLWSVSYSAVGYPAEAGYDAIARICAFVLLLSPAIRAWSIDARLLGAGPSHVPRYGLRLLQFQLAVIYLVTVWLKAPDQYWRNGELMAYFMMSIFSRVASPIWAELGRTSVLLTWGALLLEASIPFLLYSSHRRLGLIGGLVLHGGIALVTSIGMFSLAMLPLYASFFTLEDLRALGLVRGPLSPRKGELDTSLGVEA